jgi:uncharacterized protein (DUF4415 family)
VHPRAFQSRFLRFNPANLHLVAFRQKRCGAVRIVTTLAAVQQPADEGDAMTTSFPNFAKLDLPVAPRRRARPPKRKTRITIYLDDEVLDEFRSRAERTGTGYQTLINAALRTRLAVQEAPLVPA